MLHSTYINPFRFYFYYFGFCVDVGRTLSIHLIKSEQARFALGENLFGCKNILSLTGANNLELLGKIWALIYL